MSRINNKAPQPQPTRQPTRPSQEQTQKAGQESFASRFQKQGTSKKADSKQPSPSQTNSSPATTADQGTLSQVKQESSPAKLMMQRHGAPVMGRRGGGSGTVADLQAKLQGNLEGKGNNTGLLGAESGLKGMDGKGPKLEGQKLIDTDNLKSDIDTGSTAINHDAAGAAGTQLVGQTQGKLDASATVQIQGNRIPVAMMDKIVDQARVGVNASGAPEFQFDLKGDVLGGLKMRMSMEDGQLKAIFVAENPEVKKLIDGNLKDLQKNLEDRGIYIRDLEVRDPEEDRRQRQNEQNQKDREDAMDS